MKLPLIRCLNEIILNWSFFRSCSDIRINIAYVHAICGGNYICISFSLRNKREYKRKYLHKYLRFWYNTGTFIVYCSKSPETQYIPHEPDDYNAHTYNPNKFMQPPIPIHPIFGCFVGFLLEIYRRIIIQSLIK